MYTYKICNIEDDEIFYRQCKALEKNIPSLVKNKFIEADILLQEYSIDDNKITVSNDWHNGVYIQSEVDLTKYFKD